MFSIKGRTCTCTCIHKYDDILTQFDKPALKELTFHRVLCKNDFLNFMKPTQHHHFKIYLKGQVQHARHGHFARPDHNVLAYNFENF